MMIYRRFLNTIIYISVLASLGVKMFDSFTILCHQQFFGSTFLRVENVGEFNQYIPITSCSYLRYMVYVTQSSGPNLAVYLAMGLFMQKVSN